MGSVGSEISAQFLPRKRILVVDDDEAMRSMLSYLLSREGHLVMEAENGEQAFDLFSRFPFSLVLTDYCMPVMDGIALAQKVRVSSPETPIIMITGSRIREGINTECVDFIISKPFQLNLVQRTVHKALTSVRESGAEMRA